MFWVIQNNLYNESGYHKLLDTLCRMDIGHIVVKFVPFIHKLLPLDFCSETQDVNHTNEPYIDSSRPIMVCGGTTFSRIAKERGWNPGTFLNDNFTYVKWSSGYGLENVLNGDGIVTTVSSATCDSDQVFIRPVDDNKSFNGQVMDQAYFHKWYETYRDLEKNEFTLLHKDTEIIISSVKEIYAEYRFFVIDGKVVTGSMYKRGGTAMCSGCVDGCIVDFAQTMVNRWQPAKAFVIDIADTPHGYKVIEIGNINYAGFYDIDMGKFVTAMEELGNNL